MKGGGYDRRLVEQLLPAVWDSEFAYGMRNPTAPDPDMPKATVDKKKGSTLYAHLADIRSGWRKAEIPQVERQALLLLYGFDMTQEEAGRYAGSPHRTVARRAERGIGRITAHLNGVPYSEDYDGERDTEEVC